MFLSATRVKSRNLGYALFEKTGIRILKQIRILHTEASDGWGGQEMRILSESAGLRARGYDVQVVAPANAQILVEAKRYNIPTHILPLDHRNPFSILALLRLWTRLKPNVVISHSSADSWLVTIAARFSPRRPRIIRTRHLSTPVAKGPLNRWLYGNALDFLVTTGSAIRQTLIEKFRLDPERVISIPTGIDVSRFRPGDKGEARTKLGLPISSPIIGIVAVLRPWKGHRFLISALQDARLSKATLVIVGDGQDALKLRSQAAAGGLADRVIFTGRQDNIPSWLQAFDVFVLPSTGKEGVPQSLTQAMACEVPVVTTNVGAITELVQDGKTGLVVPAKNSEALADAIVQILSDFSLAQRLSKCGRRHVEAKFTATAMLDAMEKVIRLALAKTHDV